MHCCQISPAAVGDHEAVVDLLVEQMREHRIEADRVTLSDVVSRVIADEQRGFLLVAKTDDRLLGVAYVAVILSVEHGGPVGWLEELYVAPDFRERGIGTALLNGLLNRAAGVGLVAIDLEVDVEHQRAESLYARFGFHTLPRSRWAKKLERRVR